MITISVIDIAKSLRMMTFYTLQSLQLTAWFVIVVWINLHDTCIHTINVLNLKKKSV